MDAIEKIVEQILEKGQIEVSALKKVETARIDQEYQEQEEALFLKESTLIEKNQEQTNKAFKQKEHRQQLEIKQATLNQKQDYLEQLFSESIERMNQWTPAEFQEFAEQIMSQLPIEGEANLKLGELSKGKLSYQWLLDHATEKMKLHLDPEVIPSVGGFIVSKEGIEYNFLFSSLVQEIKKMESFQLAEMLFQ
ncbi:hypothetical protein [Enterococcus caccae]|uniref:V-type ATPase, subunit E n=1 Tax=Enterococcus caccae ATCC BAA-1240 TaxID=1158612 RepID=R3W9N7_9ENTE|nr:hypothetical protein [Enterococcus caccae]EOL44172.1 hypothetical protein UC7_02216 [Enterococcus caccae ATCC BAA-1240]EOT68712.1 hypothetical protein I580_01095 [Enterococcus caccae ATCC BAA-1240]OJG28072.1 hypothetical protein RU98_GL001320 [Enterococcus caccae]